MSIKAQLNADQRIATALNKYLANKSNSVSGLNFTELLIELEEIENAWLAETVVPYLTNGGLHPSNK